MPMKFGDGVRAPPSPPAEGGSRRGRTRLSLAPLAAAVVAVVAAATLLLGSTARAGTMTFNACADAQGPTSMSGWRVDNYGPWTGGTSLGEALNECASQGRYRMTLGADGRTNGGVGVSLTFTAPQNTRMVGVAFDRLRTYSSWAGPSAYLTRAWHDGNGQAANVVWGPVPSPGSPHYYDAPFQLASLDWGSMTWVIECTPNLGGSYCDASAGQTLQLSGTRISLRDDAAPVVSGTFGSLPSSGSVTGTKTVGYNVSDVGVGVYTTLVYVDGRLLQEQAIDANGGRCVSRQGGSYVFGSPVPCKASASDSVSINTAALPDGDHDFKIVTSDASGNRTLVVERTLTTVNAPVSVSPPRISHARSTPAVGETLSADVGTWERTPTAYQRRWMLCPSRGETSACEPIAGADGPTYTVSDRDAYKRLVFAVAASNTAGTSRWELSAPVGPLADADGVADPAPASITPPSWSAASRANEPRVGDRLTVDPGSWSGKSLTYTVSFQRCVAERCSVISAGSTGSYLVTAADLGTQLHAQVAAVNAHGSASATTEHTGVVRAQEDADGRDGGRREDQPIPGTDPGRSDRTGTDRPVWPVEGLANPLAGRGHEPNGSGASENARVRAAFAIRKGKRTLSRTSLLTVRSRGSVMRGTLRNADGRAITGAKIVIAIQQAGGRWRATTLVTSTAAGSFEYRLPKGPTRSVKAIYFAFGDSTQYAESNTIIARTTTPITFRVSPRSTTNGGTIRFAGAVARDGLPRTGILVTLEARYPGSRWKQFKVIRTARNGRLSASYRFTATSTRTRYQFRARVAKQTAYPFEGGLSKTVAVTVTPGT